MDKASIIKDAIDYIQELHEQERSIEAEIMELESGRMGGSSSMNSYILGGGEIYGVDFDRDLPLHLRSKKKRTQLDGYDSGSGYRIPPIEDLEVSPSLSFLLLSS